ncbi:MAG TPA: AAA family ATPase, partial [Kofleriaceae bacterium]|nr:AAA family ATPase [Kofleriaceae bacterium]
PAPVPIPARLDGHPLGTVLRWVLEKDPARRAGSAANLIARLDDITLAGLAGLAGLADDAGYLVDEPRTTVSYAAGGALTGTVVLGVRGERRQITALCCRLCLHTSARSAEVGVELLDVYRNDLLALAGATIEEFGGLAMAGLGGLALYGFGVPRAKGTDARMAACAALELCQRVRSRSATLMAQAGVGASVHVGIHAGLVTTGDAGAGGALAHSTVVAMASALALDARDPCESSITVSAEFRQLIASHYEFEGTASNERRGIELSWRTDPLIAYQLTGESLSGVFASGVAPMVGRDAELALLVEAWRGASERGRVALLRAEAGMGKSRLAHELRQLTHDAGHGCLALRFLPEMEHVSLGPLLELLLEELDVGGRGRRPSCTALAGALAGFDLELGTAVPLLCTWLSIQLEPPFAVLPFSPLKQRELLYEVLVEIYAELLRRRAGLLLIEDLHWADPSSLEWLGCFGRRLDAKGGFALVTARPELAPRWEGFELLTVELGGLDDQQVAALVTGLPAAAGLSRAVIAEIVERADGVPLFVEELARALAGSRAGSAQVQGPDVPSTLRELLASRLDEQGPAKEVAQLAAAIGREFDYELLRASSSKDEATLLADLDQLVSAGLLLGRRRVGGQTYLFRHALLRDAAYESLTPSVRRAVHDALAQTLLDEFPEQVASRPDVAARHLSLADRWREAVPHWIEAGSRALATSSYAEANAHFSAGLEQLARWPESHARDELEMEIHSLLGMGLVATQGYASAQVEHNFGRANELAARLGPAETPAQGFKRFTVSRGLWIYHMVRAELDEAHASVDQMRALVRDSPLRVEVELADAKNAMWEGRLAVADGHYRAAEAHYDPELHAEHATWFTQDPLAVSLAGHTWITALTGDRDRTTRLLDRALGHVEALGHPHSKAYVLAHAAQLQYFWRDEPMVRHFSERAMAISSELGFPNWLATGGMLHGWSQAQRGQIDAGLAELRSSLGLWQSLNVSLNGPLRGGLLAELQVLAGDLDQAIASLRASLALSARTGEHYFDAELRRLLAVALLERGTPGSAAEAEAELRGAIAVAEPQGANLLALRASVSLARLLVQQHRASEARLPLARACECLAQVAPFDELTRAREMLASLG